MALSDTVTSLITKLENSALGAVADKGPGWFDSVLAAARGELTKIPLTLAEGPAVAATATYALDKLEANKELLLDLGYEKLTAFLGRVASGQVDAATAILLAAYGGGQGAWGTTDAIVATAGDKTEAAKRRDQAALAFAEDFGSTAAKAALPLLLQIVPMVA